MSTATLRMPDHSATWNESDWADFNCRGAVQPGEAHLNPNGTLHCNVCGYTTPEPVVTAWHAGRTYLTWDELVQHEANGYVVVSISSRPGTVPSVHGPWTDHADARRAQARLRRRHRKEEAPHTVTTCISILWPDPPK